MATLGVIDSIVNTKHKSQSVCPLFDWPCVLPQKPVNHWRIAQRDPATSETPLCVVQCRQRFLSILFITGGDSSLQHTAFDASRPSIYPSNTGFEKFARQCSVTSLKTLKISIRITTKASQRPNTLQVGSLRSLNPKHLGFP